MLVKMLFILIKLSLILCLVNARTVEENAKSQLPGDEKQIDFLAASVCNDLILVLENMTSQTTCQENFWSPVKDNTQRTEVSVRCRSEKTLQLQVTPSNSWQLVVLIPETEEDHIINYSIIQPQMNTTVLSIPTLSKNYVIFSTVLNKDGRPGLWHGQTEVPAWSGEHRNYDVQMQFLNNSGTSEGRVSAVVTWNHTGDADLCFEIKNFCSKGGMTSKKIWPGAEQRIQFEKLHLDDICQVRVTGVYGTTKLKYSTPKQQVYEDEGHVAQETSSNEILPEIPQEISLGAIQDGDAWKVRVGWATPRNPPERYSVTLRTDDITTLAASGNATEVIFTDVTGEGLYNASIFAFKGLYKAHNFARAPFPDRVEPEWRWAGAAAGAWGAAGLALLAAALCWLRLRRRRYQHQKSQQDIESKPLDEALETLETESCEDQWELKSERLLLHEVVGEGAFGVVRRGSLAPNGKEVAVKMLKDYPSVDEVRAFRLEMELMKSVGAHPHVVSLVGCCSGKRPFIIAEYCARGDLLSFLRRSWDLMVSKRNAKYYNNNMETEYRNDLFKCKIVKDQSRLVVNKMYDLQGLCDPELTSLDLLSFCRQIAMGMEFLATNRLVHRDLAARNVLVTRDRTLKVADFGLSRDVYEENQYQQKGNGKMPVKWMAPESLTRRIYTSQSDVWSFGVVVWEVVTVGGAPYAEVPPARLPRLLRAGYRMPRPPNCSKQLHDIMVRCWRLHPRERPTFAELHRRLDELLNCACADEYLSLELEDDAPPAPPTPKAQRYFKMILRGKRAWSREIYERPLKAVQGNHNHYSSPPVTLSKAPA